MANAENAQLPQWVSPEDDWFRQDLLRISPGWLNPRHHLILHVLARMQRESRDVCAVIVVPHLPQAVWWNLLRPLMNPEDSLLIPEQKFLYGPEWKWTPPGCYKGPWWCTIIRGALPGPAQLPNGSHAPVGQEAHRPCKRRQQEGRP